jgi:hypothetical protein
VYGPDTARHAAVLAADVCALVAVIDANSVRITTLNAQSFVIAIDEDGHLVLTRT